MTFLKKFGQVVAQILGLVTGLGPVFGASIPGSASAISAVGDTLERILAVILSVEATGAALALPGPQKLAAATPQVAQVILASAFLAHHEIADPTKFKGAIAQITSGFADLLNSLKDKVEVENKL